MAKKQSVDSTEGTEPAQGAPTKKAEAVQVTAPNMKSAEFLIRGTAPLVINAFPNKVKNEIAEKHAQGGAAKNKKNREAKDFDALFEQAKHVSTEGWCGIHAAAFRNAMIDACRLVNYKMTMAKLTVFTIADGYDRSTYDPLVRITKGEPEMYVATVRLPTGAPDIRARPLWQPGWEIKVRIKWDADQFSLTDITNLLMRVGQQVGIGEGRPNSKNSAGLGFGLFDIVNEADEKPARKAA